MAAAGPSAFAAAAPGRIVYVEDIDGARPHLAAARSVLHLKGFGPTIKTGLPCALAEALAAAEVIAWDGDDAGEGSFTSALLPLLAPQTPPRLLVAFKFADEKPDFEESWGGRIAASRATVVCVLLGREALLARGATLADVGAALHLLSPAAGDAARTALVAMPEKALHYAALGVRGVEITRALLPLPPCVLAWGGGPVVLLEWATAVARWGAAAPLWTHWRGERERAGVSTHGSLAAAAAHPRLVQGMED